LSWLHPNIVLFKTGLSRLNPIFIECVEIAPKLSKSYFGKIWVEPAQPNFLFLDWLNPNQSGKKGFHQGLLSVWALADCEWRAAASRLKPVRLPRAWSPGMGKGGDW